MHIRKSTTRLLFEYFSPPESPSLGDAESIDVIVTFRNTHQESAKNGYVSETTVKEIAANAGFEFVAASEINANPKDKKDHAEGVWTLPPGYALGDEDKEKYAAIGESDRMTLRFRKAD